MLEVVKDSAIAIMLVRIYERYDLPLEGDGAESTSQPLKQISRGHFSWNEQIRCFKEHVISHRDLL